MVKFPTPRMPTVPEALKRVMGSDGKKRQEVERLRGEVSRLQREVEELREKAATVPEEERRLTQARVRQKTITASETAAQLERAITIDKLEAQVDRLREASVAAREEGRVDRAKTIDAEVKQVEAQIAQYKAGALGVLRLDYDYPPAPGDIDHPESYEYRVFYRVVPGLTFEMIQSGQLTPEVEEALGHAIEWLVAKGVHGITGDCGFMMYLQKYVREKTPLPVFMSALAQLPAVTCGYASNEKIAILTANGKSLEPMHGLIKSECGVDATEDRYVLVGCEDVPGFEAVALGQKVDVQKVTPGIVQKAKDTMKAHPGLRAFLLECTELPPYSDAVRQATGLPVYDAITACNFFMAGVQDNPRFGVQGWQKPFDGKQEPYKFGDHLTEAEKAALVNPTGE